MLVFSSAVAESGVVVEELWAVVEDYRLVEESSDLNRICVFW